MDMWLGRFDGWMDLDFKNRNGFIDDWTKREI